MLNSNDIAKLTDKQVNTIKQWCKDEVHLTARSGVGATIWYTFKPDGRIRMQLKGLDHSSYISKIDFKTYQLSDDDFNIFKNDRYMLKVKLKAFNEIWDQLNLKQ